MVDGERSDLKKRKEKYGSFCLFVGGGKVEEQIGAKNEDKDALVDHSAFFFFFFCNAYFCNCAVEALRNNLMMFGITIILPSAFYSGTSEQIFFYCYYYNNCFSHRLEMGEIVFLSDFVTRQVRNLEVQKHWELQARPK